MNMMHQKEAHLFTITLDVDKDNLFRLFFNAASRIDRQVGRMTQGQYTAADSLLGTWQEQATKKLFRKADHYKWLVENRIKYALMDSRGTDIYDGRVHIIIWGDKQAAMFKLVFGGQPSAIAA
jgi:hypothetical protein